ncbi:uncharacterized protein Dwil_GK22102 [Drosophila willistoni]|uniref:Ig-like domain-containing protein n=1 Tax=Drosophila willistoni TaxID=7260 RepID=B4MYC3_DROWI|nr:uncharacterized protein Dwil_GK22102 [Drosophila willistoni]
MGNGCSKCCQCNEHKQIHGALSSASSVYRKRSRGEIPIENSDRFRITQTSNAVQLAVEHVQREDAGHYTLIARTKSNDVVRRHVELIVEDRSMGEDPPVFVRRLVDLSVKVGTRTRLLTEIRSSTDLKLTWYRNDRRVCENDRITEINEGTFHYLEVSPVTLEDGGQWMLMAENLGGRNSCLGTLNVLVPKAYKTPEFVEELRAVLTEQGTVSLECKVVGVPTPHLRWFKDSKEIKAGDIFALTANADDPTSLGTYTCEARNCMGVTYSSSKVHVVGRGSREGSLKPADNVSNNSPPPIFTNELRDMSVRIGETIILGCQVVVPPWPKSVAWYNTDGRVETSDRYKLIEDGLGVYMIEIKPSESCDAGEWKCVVTSFEGCVGISTSVVTMDIPKNYRKPRFMESLRAVLTEEGLVSFECKVVGFPTPVLKWFKDGHELKPGDVYQLTGTNSLGTYCCIARNCMGETSSTAVLTVEDIQNQLTDEERLVFTHQNQAPRFLTGLKSTDAKINEPFQFKVVVRASPDPVLTWFRDELPIDPNDRYNHYRGEDEEWLMDIKAVEFVDQAEWKCVAVNDFGTSITSCFLKLQIPRHYKKPRFLECLRAVLTDEGAVNLECKVIGVPQPVLKWYKDGVELKPGDIHRIISGQDGTCCLGTYTCEARNCMGVVASSASLLGFEDAQRNQSQKNEQQVHENELQRNFSLSTIQEERTSQLYETPVGDITIDDKGDVSFSFDGKEVSVSLYETPDLTEEEALKIVEMYADQISEHVTEHNIVELPPLRFVKETSQSGKLLMEAVVIDIAPEYFSHEDDLRTEADMDDISITEITVHGSSGRDGVGLIDRETQQYVQESFEKMEEELSLSAPVARKRKKSRPTETEEFFSLSKASGSQGDEEETSDLQTFASAQMSTSHNQKQVSAKSEQEHDHETLAAPKRKKSKKPSDTDSSKTTEDEARLQDISGAVGDGLLMSPAAHLKAITDESEINRNLIALVPLAKLLKVIENHLTVVEHEVLDQSTMMMTPAAADQSIAIIRNIVEPIKQIESKLRVYSGETQIDALIQSMDDDIRRLHMGLQVIEKCVEIDETGATLIQRTSVCIIDTVGEQMKRALEELKIVSKKFHSESLRAQIELTADDIQQGLEITQGTIKSQALLQEAQDLEAAQHFTETVEKMQQDTNESMSFATISEANLPSEASALKEICQPVAKIQEALERVEMELSLEESEEEIYKKVHQKVLESIVEPIRELQSTLHSIEDKTESLAGTESMEQKINMAILDIVTPPLFELNKGLEVILNEKSDSVEGGMLTVSTVESMVPPLQEIQNGLAQLGQDLESSGGQAALMAHEDVIQNLTEPSLDVADTQKLLQSIAQAVLHFETNIERISPRLSANVKIRLQNLKDELSALIGTILDKDITRHHVELLEQLKSPIDELNYCIRQTEVKSMTGSLADLIEPLSMLQENTQKGHGLMLTAREPDKQSLQTLENIRSIIRNAVIDIEEHEFKILQQEIQQDEEQASQQQHDKSFSALRKALETKVSLEEAIDNMETLQLALNQINENTKAAEQVKKSATEAQVSLLHILQIAKNLATFSEAETTLNPHEANTTRILFECAKSFADLAKSLGSPIQEVGCEFKQVLSQFCEIVGQQKKASDEKLSVDGPLASLIQALEHLEQPLKESTSVEDLSTLDDISVLKSIAESLPTEPEIELPAATEKPSLTADVLLSDLNHGISAVLSHCEDIDVTSMVGPSAQQVHAAIIKMQDLQNSIALVHETNIAETAHSLSSESGSHQGTFAEALCSLERCVLHVEECIAQSGLDEISELELSKLKALATPLKDVRQYCEQIYNQVLDHAIDMSTQEDISQLKTSGQKQTEQIGAEEKAEVQQEPLVEVFDIQQGVASGIKQLQACLEVTQTTNTEELHQVSQIMKQLKSDLESIQTTLISNTDEQETVLAQAKIAGTMFKLKESLVHTYESGLVDSLETVESAFEDILLSLPILESQLAQEMFAKIEKSLNVFNMNCQHYDTVDQTHQLVRLKGPFDSLLQSIKTLAMQATVDIDKSSIVIVNLQSNLMSAFRALNEVSEKADNDISVGLLKTQSSLVAVFDFIENNECTIRIIELLQEIDAITTELNTLSLVPVEPTVPIDIGVIIENVSSGKAFLTELEEGLKNDNPLSVLLLNENSEDIGQLEATLIQIENEILSQPQLNQITPKQFALIETLQTQLNIFQEKLNYLNTSSSESVLATDEELLQSSSEAIDAHNQDKQKAFVKPPNEDQQLQQDTKIENLAKISKQKVIAEAQQPDEPENKKPKIIDKESTDEEIHTEKRKKVNKEQISEQVAESDKTKKLQEKEKKLEKTKEAEKAVHPSEVSEASIETSSDQNLQVLPEAIVQEENKTILEIKEIQEILSEKFEDLSKGLAASSCKDEVQSILKETKDTIESLENGDKVAKAIFKLKEHIVHTYDGRPLDEQNDREAVEAFIESLLEFCPDASKQLIHNYVKEIKTNIILTKAAIQLINESEMFLKPSLLIPKLVNLEHISDETQSKLQLDKSSEKMINLQQNLMDIFIILDDLLDEKTDKLRPQIEDAKTALLKEYDYIEKKEGKLNTAIIQEQIFIITQKMLNISEELQELIASQTDAEETAKDVVDNAALTLLEKESAQDLNQDIQKKQGDDTKTVEDIMVEKSPEKKEEEAEKPGIEDSAKTLEKKSLVEEELDAKKQKQAEKDAEKKTQHEGSEVVAEKITQEKVEAIQKPGVKDSEAEAQNAKALEKKSLEQKELNAKKQKQAEKDAEKKAEQGEVSEVVAEKITEEKVEATQKPGVKDSEAEAQNAKPLDKKSLEQKELDAKKQNQAEKDAEKKAQQGEVSEVVAEKITEEKVEETQKSSVKDSEAEAQNAKALEKKSLEQKKLDAKKQKQAEKDAEKKAQQGEVSEVVAEKITEEKVEETQKSSVKDSEAEAQNAKALEKKSLEQKKLDAKKQKQAEKDAEKKAQQGEVSEVVAEKITEEKVEETQKPSVKDSEAEAQNAKALEKKSLEQKELDAQKQKQAEKDAEKKSQQGEVSEVVAEKITEEKVEETQKPSVKDSEAEAQNAKALEKKSLEQKELDAKKQKQAEKDAEKKAQQGEVSEIVAEKITQEKVEETQKPSVKDSEAEAENAKDLENISLKEEKLDAKKQKASIEETSAEKKQESLDSKPNEASIQEEKEHILKTKEIKVILSEKFKDLSKGLASSSCNEELQSILKETKDAIDNLENGEKTAKAIFKLKEHIVHTYDGKPLEEQTDREAVEAFIESLLEFCPDASKQLIHNYVKEIKTNIILTKAAIQLINESEMFLKPSLLIPKLVNLEHISDETQSKLQLDKSSEKMINLQQNLMDIFIILDDLLDEKTDKLRPQIEDAKTALLKEYDYIEKKEGKLNTAIIQEQIFIITQKMLNISEELQELIASQTDAEETAKDVVDNAALTLLEKESAQDLNQDIQKKQGDDTKTVEDIMVEKSPEKKEEEAEKPGIEDSAKTLEKKSLVEEELDAKKQKQAEKDAEKKTQHEGSEVVAEKITQEKVEAIQKPGVKDSEAEAQNAKALEKKSLEQKELNAKKQKQAEKDAEKKAEQGEVSEVVAEKITEEKVEATQKPGVKDSEAEAQNAKVLEKKSLEQKELDAQKQKQAEKDAEKKSQRGEESEIVAEKITEEKVEETQKPSVKDLEAEAQNAKALEKKSLEQKELDAKKQKQAEKDADPKAEQGEVSEVVAEKITEEKVEATQKPDVKDSETEAQNAKALEKKSLEQKELDAKKQKQAEKDAEKKAEQGEVSEVVSEKITEEKVEETQKPSVKDSEAEAQNAKALEKKSLDQKELDAKKQKQAEKDAEKKAEQGEVSEVVAEKITEEKVEETQKPSVKDSEAAAQNAKALEKKSLDQKELDAKKQKQAEKDAENKAQQGEVSEVVAEKITEEKVEETQKSSVKDSEAEAQNAKALEKKSLEQKELDAKKQKQAEKDAEKKAQQGEVSEVVAEKITEEKVEETQKPSIKDSEAEAQNAKALEKKSLQQNELDAKKQKQAEKDAEKKAHQGKVSEVVAEKITEEKVEETQKPSVKDSEAEAQNAKALEKKSLEQKELDAQKQNQAEKDAEKKAQQGEVSEVVAEKITEEKVEETQKSSVKDSEAEAQNAKALEKKSLEQKKLDAKKQKQAEKDAEKKSQQGEESEVVAEKITEEKVEETQKSSVKDSEAEAQNAKALEKKSLEQKELDAKKQKQAEKDAEKKAQQGEVSEVVAEKITEEKVEEKQKPSIKDSQAEAQNAKALEKKSLEQKELDAKKQKQGLEKKSLEQKELDAKKQKQAEKDAEKKAQQGEVSEVIAEKITEEKVEETQKPSVRDSKAEAQNAKALEKKSLEQKELDAKKQKQAEKDAEKKAQQGEVSEVVAEKITEEKVEETQKPSVKDSEAEAQNAKALEKKSLEQKELDAKKQKQAEKDAENKAQQCEVSEVVAEKIIEEKVKETQKPSVKDSEAEAQNAKVLEKKSLEQKELDAEKQKQAEKDAEKKSQQGEVSEVVAEKITEEKVEKTQKPSVKDSEAEAQNAKALEKKSLEQKQLDAKKQNQAEKDAEKKAQQGKVSEVVAEKITEEKVEATHKSGVKDSEAEAENAKALEKKSLEQKELDAQTQNQAKKDAEKKAQQGEISEVVAEKITEEKVEKTQKPSVKDSEAEAQNAKALEKKSLEQKELDAKKQKQAEKDAENKAQQGEVVAKKKITQEKVEETQKPSVKDAEAKAQNAEALEKKSLEQKKLDAQKQKQAEKDAEKKAQQGEVSEWKRHRNLG